MGYLTDLLANILLNSFQSIDIMSVSHGLGNINGVDNINV